MKRATQSSGSALSARAAALERLKRLKSEGASGLSTYQVAYGDIYDEVDEEAYHQNMRHRVKESDEFVVDDDGQGYRETGLEIWDAPRESGAGDSSDENANADADDDHAHFHRSEHRPRGGGSSSRKKLAGHPVQGKGNIRTALFSAASKPKNFAFSADAKLPDKGTDDLFHAMMSQLDAELATSSQRLLPCLPSLCKPGPLPDVSSRRMPGLDINRLEPLPCPPAVSIADPSCAPLPMRDSAARLQLPQAQSMAVEPFSFASSPACASMGLDDQDMAPCEAEEPMAALSSLAPSSPPRSSSAFSPALPTLPIADMPKTCSKSEYGKDSELSQKLLACARPKPPSLSLDPKTLDETAIPTTIRLLSSQESGSVPTTATGVTSLPAHDTLFLEASTGDLLFYWMDAHEKPNGQLLLIGKVWVSSVGSHVSACLTVKNLQRNLFVLPNEGLDPDLQELYREIGALASRHGISRFGCKRVRRKYAFECPGVPCETDYLKVAYAFDAPPLADAPGRSYRRIFGTNTSSLELFLVKKKIMGPCWLRIKNPVVAKRNTSWCRLEVDVVCEKGSIQVAASEKEMKPPPFSAMSLHLKTIVNKAQNTNEVVAASILFYQSIETDSNASVACSTVIHAVRPMESGPLSSKLSESFHAAGLRVEICHNERALLSFLIAAIHRLDPDLIVGHAFMSFDLGVLLSRMKANKIERWSRIGRLHWANWPKSSASGELNFAERQITVGRLVCDTYLLSKDLVKSKNYSLKELSAAHLGLTREDLDYDRIPELLHSTHGLVYLIKHNENDAYLAMQLVFKLSMLQLTLQLTTLAGNLWSHTLAGGRAERNEYLLLHEFHAHKYIVPDKVWLKDKDKTSGALDEDGNSIVQSTSSKRKPKYAGGLVLEPKAGFYDKIVLLLDFNSLYPSIIQEFNICFTTVDRPKIEPSDGSAKDDDSPDILPPLPDKTLPTGILPRLLANLVGRRRVVKKMMADPKCTPEEAAQLNIRQQALKLTANSMYGCLGFPHSRFYARPIASLITAQGRAILQHTVELAQSACHLDVLYGDTDSIMIYSGTENVEEAKRLGYALKKAVNERYKLLEIELDGLFKKLLLLKKKKYAALVIAPNGLAHLETKGLDLVRRDWCALSVEASAFVLDRVMSDESREDMLESVHKYLATLAQEIRGERVALDKFVIHKNLTKNPEDYADAKSQPHVLVALQLKTRGLPCRSGDTIPYVICSGETKAVAQRAYHPDDVRKSSQPLTIDRDWYLTQQVFPPISRLCSVIEGTDSGRIAHCLGLDTRRVLASLDALDEAALGQRDNVFSDEVKFRCVSKLSLTCPSCAHVFDMEGLLRKRTDEPEAYGYGWVCPIERCTGQLLLLDLLVALNSKLRAEINKYYQGWLICDDPACGIRTRRMTVYEKRCVAFGCRGALVSEYSEKRIYYQLLYLKNLFDVEKFKSATAAAGGPLREDALSLLSSAQPIISRLYELAHRTLDQCSYPIVHLGKIFSFMSVKSEPSKDGSQALKEACLPDSFASASSVQAH